MTQVWFGESFLYIYLHPASPDVYEKKNLYSNRRTRHAGCGLSVMVAGSDPENV